jgi:hypothetical protein
VRRPPVLTLVLLLCLSAPCLNGCGWAGTHDRITKPNGFLLHGYVNVASACTAGVPDIHPGAEVKVADDAGRTIATGSLGAGVAADGDKCNYPFEISNVPGSYDTVVVLVGVQPAAKFSTSELREGRTAIVSVATTSPAATSGK